MNCQAMFGPLTSISPSSSSRTFASTSPTSPWTSRQPKSTDSSVRENTNLGCSLQISPNWRIAGVAFGSVPAVGQYEVITSYIRRP